jgi:hypothetical protein
MILRIAVRGPVMLVEVARKMLAKSVPIETIAEYTGLSKDHIQALI